MAKTTTAPSAVDPEVAAIEAALREAEAEYAEAARLDVGDWEGSVLVRRPPDEATQASRRSDAAWRATRLRWKLAQATRPKLSVATSRAQLTAAEAQLADAWAALARIQADARSADASAQLRALDADPVAAAKAVRRAEIGADVARQGLKAAEAREREQREPLLEIEATAIARRIDALLGPLAEAVADAVALQEHIRAAGARVEAPIFPGGLAECVEHFRAQNAKRLP